MSGGTTPKSSNWGLDAGLAAGAGAALALVAQFGATTVYAGVPMAWPMAILAVAAVLALFALFLDQRWRNEAPQFLGASLALGRWSPPPRTVGLMISGLLALAAIGAGLRWPWMFWLGFLTSLGFVIAAHLKGIGQETAPPVRCLAFLLLLLGVGAALTAAAGELAGGGEDCRKNPDCTTIIQPGRDGTNGRNGENGKNGNNGRNGDNGDNGQNGSPGAAGRDGRDGRDGVVLVVVVPSVEACRRVCLADKPAHPGAVAFDCSACEEDIAGSDSVFR